MVGTGFGTALGAAIGNQTGNTGAGALIGALSGGVDGGRDRECGGCAGKKWKSARAAWHQATHMLTNGSLVQMTQNKVGDEVIIGAVRRQGAVRPDAERDHCVEEPGCERACD
ncbi:MAG: glycine zipper family protein [Planctomycetales bacterium]